MNNRKRWIVLGIVLVFALGVGGVTLWFFSPGVHTIFGITRIDLEQRCYVLNYGTNECAAETTLTAKLLLGSPFGSDKVDDEKDTDWGVKVEGYAPSESGTYPVGAASLDGKRWYVTYGRMKYGDIEIDGEIYPDSEWVGHWYSLYLFTDEPDTLVIQIWEAYQDGYIGKYVAIPADSLEEALEKYEGFLDRYDGTAFP